MGGWGRPVAAGLRGGLLKTMEGLGNEGRGGGSVYRGGSGGAGMGQGMMKLLKK